MTGAEVAGLDRVEPLLLTMPVRRALLDKLRQNTAGRAELVGRMFERYQRMHFDDWQGIQVGYPECLSDDGDYEWWRVTYAVVHQGSADNVIGGAA